MEVRIIRLASLDWSGGCLLGAVIPAEQGIGEQTGETR